MEWRHSISSSWMHGWRHSISSAWINKKKDTPSPPAERMSNNFISPLLEWMNNNTLSHLSELFKEDNPLNGWMKRPYLLHLNGWTMTLLIYLNGSMMTLPLLQLNEATPSPQLEWMNYDIPTHQSNEYTPSPRPKWNFLSHNKTAQWSPSVTWNQPFMQHKWIHFIFTQLN